MTPEVLDEFLTRPHIGVLATLRRDGLPYTVPVWWEWDGRGFWLTGTTTRVWCRQLLVDPRASLCIEATAPHPGHVGADGAVTVHPAEDTPDFWAVQRRLADKYVGRGDPANAGAVDAFVANMRTEPRILFHLALQERSNAMRAIDMSVYEGKRADREHQQAMREQRP